MTEKLPISGYKFSEALVQINLWVMDGRTLTGFLDQFYQQRINLVYITLSPDLDGWDITFAVTLDAWPKAEPLIDRFGVTSRIQVRSPVGTLTVFPHRSRLILLEDVLQALAEDGLPVYSIASSLSSLTFATDYAQLDNAGRILQNKTQLPASFTPIRPQWRIRQI
jgi:aspartokinase